MPKRQRREQKHLRQTSTRRRSYTMGGTPQGERYTPPFPMNLFQNVKLFFAIGAVVMVGSIVAAALLQSQNPTTKASVPPTPTPSATGSETPATASPTPAAKSFAQAEQVIDATKQYTATIKTDMGDIVIKLFPQQAPKTVNSFVFLAQKQFFDGTTFHRVSKGFVIQAGDPTATGSGGPGYLTDEDKNDLKNLRGYVSMAKSGPATNFGSQFFINLKDNPALDTDGPSQKRFYPFGQVVSGMDVADAIGNVQVMGRAPQPEKPVQNVNIISVTVSDAAAQ